LRELLACASQGELERVFGVRGALLGRARVATESFLEDRAALTPAWRRYSGVVWSHLAPETLSASQRHRLVVPSGLYGLSAGDDVVADYRLKMTARLGGQSLAAQWRPVLADALASYAVGRVVYDLLPIEHRASIVGASQMTRLVAVSFRDENNGRLVGHDAKAAKGVFARHLLDGLPATEFAWGKWTARECEGGIEVLHRA
jgi:cytoplasmic iron level regulating protein YaaA (DUF328/UPF0246 family)